MTLRDLLFGVTAEAVAAVPVSGVSCHSKQVRQGDVFVAVQGPHSDGHAFIAEAIERGAAAIVAQRIPAEHFNRNLRACPCVVVRDTHQALVTMAERFYGHPADKLNAIGVTGTNGKTTTAYLLHAILERTGRRTGLLGSIKYQVGDRELPSRNTTPGPLELQRLFAQMVGEGLDWCAMEVSSHALSQGRVDGLSFKAALFTNLGNDHLDYHITRESYAAAKRKLFEYLKPDGVAVINADDAYGRTLRETLPCRNIVSYGIEHPAKVRLRTLKSTWQGLELSFETPWGVLETRTALIGRHNASNIAAAAATLLALGLTCDEVGSGLEDLAGIPGRMERVANDRGINIVVDYAHTDDALRLVLRSLRELSGGKVIALFGAGGDRDQGKRPKMGRVASLLADEVILTSDNPRGEDPGKILAQIRGGFAGSFDQYKEVLDREEAIALALSQAQPGDTVLIAGKGHEAYQIFGNVSVPFNDRLVIESLLRARHSVAVGS